MGGWQGNGSDGWGGWRGPRPPDGVPRDPASVSNFNGAGQLDPWAPDPTGAYGPGGSAGNGTGGGGLFGGMPYNPNNTPQKPRTGNRGNIAGPQFQGGAGGPNGGMAGSRIGFRGTITGAGTGGQLAPKPWDAGGSVAGKTVNPVANNAAYQAKRQAGMQGSLSPQNAALAPYYVK